jgi:hypothetical protein
MYKNELPVWAVSFLTSVEVNEKEELVVTNPSFSLHGSITRLRWILEEHDISRTPPDCKLAHAHYRNVAIHKEYKDSLYSIVEKGEREGFYVEYYVREENEIYYAGYEAKDMDGKLHSYDRCLFDITNENERDFYNRAVARLKELGVTDQVRERARLLSIKRTEAFKELMSNIK